MYVFIISLCIVAVAFVVQRFANQIDEQLNACGTGTFKDGACVCQHPYTGTHCEIVDCGYGKLVDSVFAYDTITTPKGPTGCECEAQYWGFNCANCTSKYPTGCTGPCKDQYFGSRCDILCKSGTENDKQGVEHREAGGTYNYFVESRGFCLNYGNVKGTVKCREGWAGAHCQHECLDCVYGKCNLDDGSCDCFDGYFGTLCQGTCPGRCSGLNGVCQEDGTCKCYDGFTGDDCSKECCVEGRGTELSSVHGTCLKDVGGCNCSKEVVPVDLPEELYSDTPFHGVGWEGSQCDCHENITCGGRGRCVEGGCECTANFQGARCDICNDSKVGPFCQYDRWQCPDRDNAHGEFVAKNSRGDYGCKCNSGFTGDTCEECIASAYPKTGDKMCTIIIPDTLCHDGSVNPNYDGTVDMCICDTNFDTQTDCASCLPHWYGPDCDYYCRESTQVGAEDCGSTGGVCSNSGPGCICPKGMTLTGGICVTCGGDAGCENGNCIEGRCRCDPNYYGDHCNITAPESGGKICSGYPSVIVETNANCDLTADCLDESADAPVANQIVAQQARLYDRRAQMFCHRDDTPKGLKNIQGCCVDKNGDGFCDKDKLQSTDCTFYNAAGNPEDGEVVNDICNKRVLEDETNVFEWCLSKEKDCTMNGVCEDPELCENRCDAGLGPAEWIKIWEWEHSRTMSDVMSESWKFASDFPDPYEYRKSYTYENPCPATHPHLNGPFYSGNLYWCYQNLPSNGPCNMYNSGIPPPEGGAWGSNQEDCILSSKSTEPFPALDAKIDDVCVAGEMYDVCRDYLIPDDANVFNMTHKFTDKWEPMPNYQDCALKKVISVNVDGKVVLDIDPIHAGILETTEANTAVFGRYQNGEAAYTGTVDHMIDSITVFGKGFTGAKKLTILIYDYESDTCSDFVRKVGSHYDLCSQIKFHELDYDWGAFCKWRPISLDAAHAFDDRCYRQSTVCTAGCDNYQEGCEGLPLLSEHPTPMPAPCDQHWDNFCDNYMDFEHKEEGVCAYSECSCEGYGVGGPACDMQCPVPAGVSTELSCGSDLNMGKCIKDRGVIAFGVEQGKCDCYNGGNPAEGCTATCEGEQDCSRDIDTPFSFEYINCNALSDIDTSKTVVGGNGSYTCHVFLRDSACNFFRGRCECATPFTAYTDEDKPIYLNPHGSYRVALMQGYEIDEYLPFTTYDGTRPDRAREAFDNFDPNFKCFKDMQHNIEVSCDWIRALKHFARGGSYRIGDCSHLAPGTDIENQVPCSGHGFPQGGTCACDYAEEFETRSSGVGLSFEQPGLTETPWRGKACQFICPGYDMKTMSSVCSGHGRCETDGRCACDQGWTGYKCDLRCEAEQKPLTCSGHGVCDERSIILRGDIIDQLKNSRCEHLLECNAGSYVSGPCTNETMTLARDRVIKSGNFIYHMYYDDAMKISTYNTAQSSSTERNVVLDDFSIEGTAVRHDYDFGSDIPFMPCQDRMDISREHPAHPLLPEMASVELPCNVLAQKTVITENGIDKDYFQSYRIMCGVCDCEEKSQTGNWTGYDCRTPALGFFRSDARSQCPGMTNDMNPCNGGGTCRWGSTDGLGLQIRDAATKCYCGDVTDEATLETAPRSEHGVLVHASSHGTPLFYDEIDEFEKILVTVGTVDENIVFTDTGESGVCLTSGTQTVGPRMYEGNTNDNPGTTESELVQACGTACVNSYRTGQPASLAEPWTGRAADDSTLLGFSVIRDVSKSYAGRCYCNTQTKGTCISKYDGDYKWYSIDITNTTTKSSFACPNGTEPIKYAEDCRYGFKTDEPYSLIPSFQYCELPDRSDQVQTIGVGQTGNVDEVVSACYESCINGEKTSITGGFSDPNFWSKHTKEDITHFSVVTATYDKGRCVCYATNVDDCKNGDVSVPLTSYPNEISYRINHHSHPYDLTTQSYRTIPTLSSLTTGTCQKEFQDEVFPSKVYGPTIKYKASSSVCEEAYELDGTEVTPDEKGNIYSTRLPETDPLYDRDAAKECANRCHATDQGYDGFMVLSYVPSGNINSCLCGKKCDTPQTGFPYFKMYSMRIVPDPYKTDNTQSICHPSPLRLSNYKSDCSCKFGFTGNTCETPRMMCLWNGEETDGTECICNDNGEPNPKVSKYGCCTKGTYWDQDKYASFTPLSDFEPLPVNRFYQDAFLYVCKPPETLLDYKNDQERILDIHNYVANTDEYLLTKPAVCGDAPEKQLFTSVFQTLTSKSPETFTVTRGSGDEARSIVIDKDKTTLELKEGSDPKDQCAAFCVSKNKGYKGFSIFTPKPVMVKTSVKVKRSDAGSPNVRCKNDDRVHAYLGVLNDRNPGWGVLDSQEPIKNACFAACQFRPRVARTETNGYIDSTPQKFWEVYGPEDITYIYIHDALGSDMSSDQGSCSCHTGDLDTCDTEEPSTVDISGDAWYTAHTYRLERGDTECTCEPYISNMDNQEEFQDPMSYEDNEGWDAALPRTTKRYDIQFPVDVEAEAQNFGCFENIDGRVLKIDQLSGTTHSISTTATGYVNVESARSSVDVTFDNCYEDCKHDDFFEYGFTVPPVARYKFEGTDMCDLDLRGDTKAFQAPKAASPEECYKSCRYRAGFTGFSFREAGSQCACSTNDQAGCTTIGDALIDNRILRDYCPQYAKTADNCLKDFADGGYRDKCEKSCYLERDEGYFFHRYSASDDYIWDKWTALTNGVDGMCSSNGIAQVRPYEGTGDNPGADDAARIRACFDASLNIDGDNIIAPLSTDGQNVNFWNTNTADAMQTWAVTPGSGRCYAYAMPTTQAECLASTEKGGTWFKPPAGYAYTYYIRKPPPPRTKTCTCYSAGNQQILSKETSQVFELSSTNVGTLMTVQKTPAVNPAPCNVNSYIALGDDIVGAPCNCPIEALEEAYVTVGYQSSIIGGICNSPASKPNNVKFEDAVGKGRCSTGCTYSRAGWDGKGWSTGCDAGLVCYQRGEGTVGQTGWTMLYDTDNMGHWGQGWDCSDSRAPVSGPRLNSRYGLKIQDTGHRLYDSDFVTECAKRCRDEGVGMFDVDGDYCSCGTSANCPSVGYSHSVAGKVYKIIQGVSSTSRVPGCEGTIDSGVNVCIPGDFTRENIPEELSLGGYDLTLEQCKAQCDADIACDSFSYAEDGVEGDPSAKCRTSIDCTGYEYKFEGSCSGNSGANAKLIGILPNIQACRDRCASYAGFLYSEDYKKCICEDDILGDDNKCPDGSVDFIADPKYSRYQHNFKPATEGEKFEIYKKEILKSSQGRYCTTGERVLYTKSITDPLADDYACAQQATMKGMEVSRGSVNGLIFTCYASDRYYSDPDDETDTLTACATPLKQGGTQYILQKGMQRRVGIQLAASNYQDKVILDDLFNSELYPTDSLNDCKDYCDPFKYRHFQYSSVEKTCQCIKKEKSLLRLTGDKNNLGFQIYDFTHGLIDSPHEMCFCEGFYLFDGIARACPAGKYSSKLTPCSAACTDCPLGQFSDKGASECSSCVAGQVQDSPTSCAKCPVGKFAKSGAIECSECEIGKYASNVGMGECTVCPTGKFQSPAQTGSTTDNCNNCPAGWDQTNMEQTSCNECATGRYSTVAGTEECDACVAGKYLGTLGSTSEAQCKSCNAGKYQGSSGQASCKSCGAGKYQGSTGMAACSPCNAGKYQGSSGQASCKSCGAGKKSGSGAGSCSSCSAGYYSSSGASSCSECGEGKYQTQSGQGSCTTCPVSRTDRKMLNEPYSWGTNDGYGYGFFYPNDDRSKEDSCLYVQGGDYNLQNGNPSEGFNYNRVHCWNENQSPKIRGYIVQLHVLRWCWTTAGNCNDILPTRMFNYDLKNTGRTNFGWRQCKPYLKGYRL